MAVEAPSQELIEHLKGVYHEVPEFDDKKQFAFAEYQTEGEYVRFVERPELVEAYRHTQPTTVEYVGRESPLPLARRLIRFDPDIANILIDYTDGKNLTRYNIQYANGKPHDPTLDSLQQTEKGNIGAQIRYYEGVPIHFAIAKDLPPQTPDFHSVLMRDVDVDLFELLQFFQAKPSDHERFLEGEFEFPMSETTFFLTGRLETNHIIFQWNLMENQQASPEDINLSREYHVLAYPDVNALSSAALGSPDQWTRLESIVSPQLQSLHASS